MQVVQAGEGWADVLDGTQVRRVRTTLVGPCQSGQWLLMFLDDAREIISAERAVEVKATLALLAAAMGAGSAHHASDAAAFALPSAMSLRDLQQLTQDTPP